MRVWPPTRITDVDVARRSGRRRRARAGTARACAARAARPAPRARRARASVCRWRGPVGAGRDERQVDLGLRARSTARSSPLGGLLEPLQRHAVAAQVDAVVLRRRTSRAGARRSRCRSPRRRGTCRRRSSARGTRRRRARGSRCRTCRRRGRRPRRAAAPCGLDAVGERRRGRLVDDAQDVEAGDAAGVLGRLALRVVEVRRHRDHRLGDRLAEPVLGGLPHLAAARSRETSGGE